MSRGRRRPAVWKSDGKCGLKNKGENGFFSYLTLQNEDLFLHHLKYMIFAFIPYKLFLFGYYPFN